MFKSHFAPSSFFSGISPLELATGIALLTLFLALTF